MGQRPFHLLCFCLFAFVRCVSDMEPEEANRIGRVPCRRPAAFISRIGLDPARAAFSTTEKRYKGVVLMEVPRKGDTNTSRKLFQDSSWAAFGDMGPLTTDEDGNVYTAAVPFVNTLEQNLKKLQTIYRIDAESGRMAPFFTLPETDSVPGMVPFGILGLYYDCHGRKLYAATVAGSTAKEEKGQLIVLDPFTLRVTDRKSNIDAMGLFVGGVDGQKRLFFGRARTPEIHSLPLDRQGSFSGKSRMECSLENLGPRGDDKARRIRFDGNGNLIVHGTEFRFNLTAGSEKLETVYRFRYDDQQKTWVFLPGTD